MEALAELNRIVARHGRNLDTVPATIEALPSIAKRVNKRIPVLMDGGIRRGTDVLKAIALGATTTRERVAPIISASVSWLTLAMIGSGLPSLPKLANKRRARARRFSLELNS